MATNPQAQAFDRVNLVYESTIGDRSEQVELPFKLLVLADFTRDERSEYLDQQMPVLLKKDNHELDVIFQQFKPALNIKVENCLQQSDEELLLQLNFTGLDDFLPQQLVRHIPWLNSVQQFTDRLAQSIDGDTLAIDEAHRSFIEKVLQLDNLTLQQLQRSREQYSWLIADLEQRIADQLDAILHHPEFHALEASWRALAFLIERTDFQENCEIAVLNLSKQGLIEDFEDAAEVIQSGIYQRVYSEEYGQFGGRPYGAMIADYSFTPSAPDVKCLQQIASVCAVSHAPFIAAAAPALFDIDNFSKFSRLRDFKAIFEQPAFIKWKSFRQSVDSRYVGLTVPSFLLRDSHRIEVGGMRYREKVRNKDQDLLWGNAAFAFATRLVDSFAKYRWCLNCTGKSGGLVSGLNMNGGKIATQFILTDRRESDVVDQGFMPLSVHKGDDTCAFYFAYSVHAVNVEESDEEQLLSQRLAAQLPYLMIVSRISQYLKVMQRENLGAWRNRLDIDKQLNKWLSQYVSDMDNPAPGVRARRPLRHAEVIVREVEGKQDWFVTQIGITPHLKFMGNSFQLTETSKMEKS